MTTTLRILHVCGGMNIGGVQNMLMKMYRIVDREQIQFDFLVYDRNEQVYAKEIEKLGGRVIYVRAPQLLKPFTFILDVKKVIKKNGPYDIVHAHTLHNEGLVLLASKVAKVSKRIAHSRASLANNNTSLIRKVYFLLMRFLILTTATDFLACSKQAGNYLFGNYFVKTNKVNIINNGIEIEPYRELLYKDDSLNIRETLNINKNDIVIGHVGRFSDEKNQAFLIPLMNELSLRKVDFKVIFVGDGPNRKNVEKLVNKEALEHHAIFTGFRSDIPQLMRMFDVFILPSIFEGFGTVMVEAQAAGTPCIAADTVPIDTDTGLGIVQYKSLNEPIENWSDTILELANFKKIPIEYSIKHIEANGYEMKTIINRYLSVYGI